ncbi:MAG: Cyclic di-GMP phosphodiesterase response regulator RpfG [Syntrophorhabdus sp. PtaB.Bin006]|nr:MAG: Cyclic di-GMP phosphodiesterase response regulator RpfG [Syntrophorhabdus sp. PtaB.Bin006]
MKNRDTAEKQSMEKPAGSKPEQADVGPTYAAEALRDNEERYRLIVNTADEGIWVLDEQYLTTFVNRRMAGMLGYSRIEMEGKSLSFFLFEEDLPDYEVKTARRREGIAERYERRLRRKDGSTLWALVSATPIMDKDKHFQGSFAMYTDITERKQAEDALLESEAKYRSIFENAVEGMFQSTPEGRLISANPAMVHIFGYASPEEMISSVTNIGRQLYTNTDDRRAFMQLLEHHGITGGFESQFYRKDGSVLWGSLNVRAVKDSGGTILYYEGTLMDITARKNAEEELKKSEAKYRNIFENAVEGIFQVTADGRYMSVNPALARIHGYSSPEEMVNSVTDIAHQLYVDPSRRDELMRQMKEKGFVKGFEIMMRRKDGGLQWVSMASHAIRDVNGTVLYHEGTLEDITSRKLGDEELKQLRKTLGGTIRALSSTVETRDPGISGHQGMVSNLAVDLSRAMELPRDMIKSIEIAGLIHDIGKVSVPVEILSKPKGLTRMEYDFIKLHPQSGYEILKEAELPYPVAEIILQHHERLDGSGYPAGLKGNEILREARILAVADVVAAMLSPRPYRPAHGMDAALNEIEKNKGILYDSEVVDVCLKLFTNRGFQF